jgi:hypothetical protein
MAEVFKAPAKYPKRKFTIFLAGSIDMGEAQDWQSKVANDLNDLDVVFLNPRRDDWDSSWTQSIKNKQFKEQVTWELKGQEDADLVVFYFADGSKSPITLLELGLAVGADKSGIVFCTDKFYRKGNVDVVADYYGYPVADDYEDFISAIRDAIEVIGGPVS